MDREIPKEERQAAMKKRVLLYGGIAIGAAAIIWGISLFSRSSVKLSELQFSTVTRGDLETTVSASGKVSPSLEEVITSPIATRVVAVYHKPGDQVEAGTPLLMLDRESARTDYDKLADRLSMGRLQLDQLEANNRTKLSDLDMQIKVSRMKNKQLEAELAGERYLDSIGSGTTDKVREVEFTLRSNELALQQLEQQYENERLVCEAELNVKRLEIEIDEKELSMLQRTLDDAEIRSPRRATVTEIVDQIGAQIGAGQQVAKIADLSHFKIIGEAPDGYANAITIGCRSKMRVSGKDIEGSVVNVTPTATNGMITFTVALDCDSLESLRSGLKGDVYVYSGTRSDVLRIDNSSFYNQPGTYELYVRNGGEIVRRKVQLGQASYDHIEVVSGLAEGDQVVISDISRHGSSQSFKIKQ